MTTRIITASGSVHSKSNVPLDLLVHLNLIVADATGIVTLTDRASQSVSGLPPDASMPITLTKALYVPLGGTIRATVSVDRTRPEAKVDAVAPGTPSLVWTEPGSLTDPALLQPMMPLYDVAQLSVPAPTGRIEVSMPVYSGMTFVGYAGGGGNPLPNLPLGPISFTISTTNFSTTAGWLGVEATVLDPAGGVVGAYPFTVSWTSPSGAREANFGVGFDAKVGGGAYTVVIKLYAAAIHERVLLAQERKAIGYIA